MQKEHSLTESFPLVLKTGCLIPSYPHPSSPVMCLTPGMACRVWRINGIFLHSCFAHNLSYLWTVLHIRSLHRNDKSNGTSSTTYTRRSYKDSRYAFAFRFLYPHGHLRSTDILQWHYIIFAGLKSTFLKQWSPNLWKLCPQCLKGMFHLTKIKHHMLMKYCRHFNLWIFFCTVMNMVVVGAPQKPTQLTQREGLRGLMLN